MIGKILADSDDWDGSEVPELKGVSWFLCMSGERIAGCFMIEVRTLSEIRAHINMLREFRGAGSAYAVTALLDWFSNSVDDRANKLTAEVPEHNMPCIRLAETYGFKREGYNRESFFFNGRYEGQYILGITKKEARCQR